jgi:hypothetical protein
MSKFSQTKLFESMWDNTFGYDLTNTRSMTGLCLMYYVIQYFKSNNLLEIGYKHGTDFIAMMEATEPGATLRTQGLFHSSVTVRLYTFITSHTMPQTFWTKC